MNEPFSFFASGTPAPGGSKSAYPLYRNGRLVMKNGRPIIRIVDAGGKRNKEWRLAVSEAAKAYFDGLGVAPIACAIELRCAFFMPRPKAHFRAKQQLRPNAPRFHLCAPDATKLFRAVEDSLAGIAFVNDSQVVRQTATKMYTDPNKGEKSGCAIWIFPLT